MGRIKLYLILFMLSPIFLLSERLYGGEIGLKVGSSTVSYSSQKTTGEKDLNFTLNASIYFDHDIFLTKYFSVSPSLQIDYAYKTTDYVYLIGYGYADEKFTYTSVEINGKGKVFLGSSIILFFGGGFSWNRFAVDYEVTSSDKILTKDEESYLGIQGFGGIQFLFSENYGIGAEYKYKVFNSNTDTYDFENQEFVSIGAFIRFK